MVNFKLDSCIDEEPQLGELRKILSSNLAFVNLKGSLSFFPETVK